MRTVEGLREYLVEQAWGKVATLPVLRRPRADEPAAAEDATAVSAAWFWTERASAEGA